jgi:hypothetical protein
MIKKKIKQKTAFFFASFNFLSSILKSFVRYNRGAVRYNQEIKSLK